jgi:hypothetical protein
MGHPLNDDRRAGIDREEQGARMKILTVGPDTFLVGDDIADAVVEYAVALSESNGADQVDVIDAESGTPVTMVLSAGISVTSRPALSGDTTEPDDTGTLAYIEGRLALRVDAAPVAPTDATGDRAVLDADTYMDTPDELPEGDADQPDQVEGQAQDA